MKARTDQRRRDAAIQVAEHRFHKRSPIRHAGIPSAQWKWVGTLILVLGLLYVLIDWLFQITRRRKETRLLIETQNETNILLRRILERPEVAQSEHPDPPPA